ncbi:MAG: response regulator transcription factor [bacterium]
MKILLVEDSKRLQESLQKAFKNMGYAVDFALDGEEGLWLAQNNDYDIVILDLMIPKMDGATVLKNLRETDKKTPVLILSARDAMEDKVGGLNIGADDYLTKPFALEELTARINAVVRRKYSSDKNIVKFSNVEMDISSKKVHIKGKEVDLTPREYTVLEYILLRRGKLVSRTEIESHVYNYSKELMSNVVDSVVCNIRKKLGSSGSLIITRRGFGYIIE